MSFSDLFGSGEHLRNLGHFAAIANIAAVHGEIQEREQKLLQRFARKLDISEEEYKKVMENPAAFPVHPHNSYEKRLERLHDVFTIIYSDNEMDEEEARLLKRYAAGLGFSSESADAIINKSMKIFSGQIAFDDYKYLVDRK